MVRYSGLLVIFFDLFYYDNIVYVDLLDYFFVWLRRYFKDVFFDLMVMLVVFKVEELVVIVY